MQKTANTSTPIVNDIRKLLAHALALEVEAAERYAELAAIMGAHNNPEVEDLFGRMARIEEKHVAEIRGKIERRNLTALGTERYRWIGLEGPETTDYADLHYRMTPHQALSLALLNERRARDFYQGIARASSDPEVVKLAGELAEEEREHVRWVESWLEQLASPEEGWDHDDDPPNLQG